MSAVIDSFSTSEARISTSYGDIPTFDAPESSPVAAIRSADEVTTERSASTADAPGATS